MLKFRFKIYKECKMSNLGKLITIGIIGAVGYYAFVKKENPLAKTIENNNPIKEYNKEYNDHRTEQEQKEMGKGATTLQDDPSMRAITKDKQN